MNSHSWIEGYIAVERAAASLYISFMQMFPREKDFWEDLLKDEMEHASFLSDAGSSGFFDVVQSTIPPPPMPLVEKTLKFAENLSTRIKSGPVSFEDALRMALQFEESMVEVFANELIAYLLSDHDKSFIEEKIARSEQVHVDKIRDMMIKRGFLQAV